MEALLAVEGNPGQSCSGWLRPDEWPGLNKKCGMHGIPYEILHGQIPARRGGTGGETQYTVIGGG